MPIKGIILILLIAVIIGIGWRGHILEWFRDEFDEQTQEDESHDMIPSDENDKENKE